MKYQTVLKDCCMTKAIIGNRETRFETTLQHCLLLFDQRHVTASNARRSDRRCYSNMVLAAQHLRSESVAQLKFESSSPGPLRKRLCDLQLPSAT
jgi:hypothetical protein